MHTRIAKAAVAVLPIALLIMTPWSPATQAADTAEPLSGTIYGAFDYTQGAWVGHAILRFGKSDPVKATFVDRNTSFDMKDNGAIYGTETITLKFDDGSGTFEIQGTFTGIPQVTPNLYLLHEIGTMSNGTGKYQNLSGHVWVEGPFLLPDPTTTPGAPPWIAEIHGPVKGMK